MCWLHTIEKIKRLKLQVPGTALSERIGHVFQGRYKAILVQDERYLLSLLRYVHQNSVKAGMSESIEEYKWCSDIFYRTNKNGFININTILDMLSPNRKEAISKYQEYMKQEEQTDYDNIRAIGEEAYQIMCSTMKKAKQKKSLDEILIGLEISQETYELIKHGSRRRDLTIYKVNYLKAAQELNYTFEEMGHNIGITESAVRNILNRCK